MRVVPKLTLAFILCTSAILALNGFLRVKREVRVYEEDRTRDHRLMGLALGEATAVIWNSDGEARALAVLAHVNTPEARIRVGWVWLDDVVRMAHSPIDANRLGAAPDGVPVSVVWVDPTGADFRYTFVPLRVNPSRAGALELSESLEGKHRFVHRTILDTVLTTVALAIASALLSTLLGLWIVGRPMRSLIEKARRTGRGDFSGPLHMRQKDELALLSREMNTMCDQLVLAHERADAETAARIAAIEQLRHADRLMTVGKLASGIAHELGTPLNVVAARAAMIADGETSNETTVSYARIIVDAADKMTRIIRSLLEFARRKGPQKAPQLLEPIVARTLELLGPLGAKRQVTLALRPGKIRPVEVDQNQFEQVVTNLVVNAIQSMNHQGNVLVSVAEELIRPPADIGGTEAEYARVSVKDEGAGIAPENVHHVFEPFFTTKDVGEGTGLGLSVAYGIVRDHGGWIAVRSGLGEGTEFSVYLPFHGPQAWPS
jgi:two-component system, NtrC family, sensor kinase